MNTNTISDLKNIICELIKIFEELIELEKSKLQTIINKNLLVLEESMKKEQVYSLKLKGFDIKREKLQRELFNKENITFKECIQLIPEGYQEEFRHLFDTLKSHTESFNKYNKEVKNLLEINVYKLDKIIDSKKNPIITTQKSISKPFSSRKV